MTESIIAGLSSPSIMSTASSTYYAPFNSMGHADSVITTESQAQVKNRGAATAKNLTVFVQGNGRGTATLVTLRVNGADTAMSISIPGGGTSVFVEGTPHNISIADGDLVDVAVALGTGGGGIIIASIAVEMVRTTAAQMLAAVGSVTLSNANGDRILPPIGVLVTSGSYTTPTMTALEACTFSNLQVNVTTADTATQVFRSIKNLSFGNQAVSVPAGVPGLYEDTTHSDTLAAGDTFSIQQDQPATSVTYTLVAVRYVGGSAHGMGGGNMAFDGFGSGTKYLNPFGSFEGAAEDRNQFAVPIDTVWSKLSMHVVSNDSPTTMVVKSRIEGVDGVQALSISPSATGLFQDLTHQDSVTAGQRVSIQASGQTGFTNLWWHGSIFTGAVVGGGGGGGGGGGMMLGGLG
jgi:hypothetical protein